MNGRELSNDDRGSISPLSHALTIAITTILVIGLTVGASGLLQDERQSATREDLRTIGNRLAGELVHVDQLAQRGGSATIQSSHTERVAGNSYSVDLRHGPACDRNRIDAETCLRLSVEGDTVTQWVPVRNETEVSLNARTSGQFVLSAKASSTGSQRSDVVMQDLSTRVGIGEDVTRNGEVIGGTLGNQPPLADFTFEPTAPTAGQQVRFNANKTFDADGNVDTYQWDWDGDGTVDDVTTDPVINHTFDEAGNYYVDLQVADEEGAISNITRFIDVSGLVYNEDLSTGSDDDTVTFSVTNDFDEQVTITHVLVDPDDDSITAINKSGERWSKDITLTTPSGDSGEKWVNDGLQVYKDGRIEALDGEIQLSGGTPTTTGETATVEVEGLGRGPTPANMNGERLRFGLKYTVDGTTNSTIFTDVVGGPGLSDYELVEDASGAVHLQFESTQELDTIDVTLGGDTSGTLDEGDFTQTATGSGYRYETDSAIATASGTYWARLDRAETASGVTSGRTPLNDTIVTTDPSGDYVWTTAGDWDDIRDSTGIVHENFGDHSADTVELGYSASDEGGSNLVGYWPLDDQSGTQAVDMSPNSNDGTIEGDPTMTPGVGDSQAYAFDGSNDRLRVPYDSSLEAEDEQAVTVSTWVRKSSSQSGWIGLFQNSDEAYNLQFGDGNVPEFTVYDPVNYWGGNRWRTASNGATLSNGQWAHLVGVYDGSEAKLYWNGNLVDTTTAGYMDENTNAVDLGIAENVDLSDNRHLHGTMDEVRVYDRALAPGEIRDLYETPTKGEFTTDWQSGPEYQQNDIELSYDADIDSGETVEVWVIGEKTSNGKTYRSDKITLDSDDDRGSVDVSGLNGLGNNGGKFHLEVELSSSTVSGSPTVDALSLEETP